MRTGLIGSIRTVGDKIIVAIWEMEGVRGAYEINLTVDNKTVVIDPGDARVLAALLKEAEFRIHRG